ncbi:hypothetical protein [Williamsia sp. CHRR-6]|uniref:hypothetical protein n=1 Tax=Williamsia sp. CHRR-6 TaxID=2835871 RepID=UPI001BDB34C0|nr:hypothetical protein [Williamsia sp. CHRR-6]MBT0566781.1 hypothetical protein [Williamsia sp. CHRR-6]
MPDLTPPNQRPVQVQLEVDIVQTDRVAVWVTSIFSYRDAFTFELNIRKKESTKYIDTYGFGRPPSDQTAGQVLFGMEFADGSVVSNLPNQRRSALHFSHSWGGRQAAGTRFYSELLPVPGDAIVYFAWPYYGIGESNTRVNTDPILEASQQAIVLWDEKSDVIHTVPEDEAELAIPSGGWFEKQAGSGGGSISA